MPVRWLFAKTDDAIALASNLVDIDLPKAQAYGSIGIPQRAIIKSKRS
jgi:hypothetical protein